MLQQKNFRRFYLISLLITAVLAFYPVKMGVSVMSAMLKNGFVWAENYPKYIIPYTPISLAVITGVILMPLVLKLRKYPLLVGSAIALVVFFLAERYMESQVLVKSMEYSGNSIQLEGWQLGLCIAYPGAMQMEVWEAVDLLLGGYDPSFKIHFYAISVVLILAVLSCFYGFGKMVIHDDDTRRKPLLFQTTVTALFLGMCIWACFTAFYRTGSIRVSPLSAVLMGCFFILFGTTMGVMAGFVFYGRSKLYSVTLPSCLATAMTALMYVGEMQLLDGRVYRFGDGILFDPIGSFALAPVDLLVILVSGIVCAVILTYFQKSKALTSQKN